MTRISYIFTLIMAWSIQMPAQDTLRQRSYYPVPVSMEEENVEWRQDVYRELNLQTNANAGLYSPADQEEQLTGLFAHIFNMALKNSVRLYKYELEGNEKLTPRNMVSVKDILDDYHITYTTDSTGTIRINRNDVPYSEVTTFYLKEAVYYDITNSTFRHKVLALCPVLVIEDEFSDQPVRYPMFWVRYGDIQRTLRKVVFSPEANNLAMRMTMDDFFTLNRYKGDIYKVYNAQGTTLSQYCENDTAMNAERARIEGNIQKVKNTTYNVYYNDKKPEVKDETPAEDAKKDRRRWVFPWQKKKNVEPVKEAAIEDKAKNADGIKDVKDDDESEGETKTNQ